MELLIIPVPLFSAEMAVGAYCFRFQLGNNITQEANAAAQLDGAMNNALLETLKTVGIEPFAMDKPIFVPVSAYMLLGDLARQCPGPFNKIVFLMSGDIGPTDDYLTKIKELKSMGFNFAMQNISNFAYYKPILDECEYLLIDQTQIKDLNLQQQPFLKLVATNIDTLERFSDLMPLHFSMYEGMFYRIPITKGKNDVSPLKANLINLLNTVSDESFEFSEVSDIITRDTALSVSLLQMVNSPFLGTPQKIKTINHAVAMLGQQEVRKWAMAAVSRSLGSDKPDEITHLSLIRAKFAENLAPLYRLEKSAESLFLMGLFSILGIVLDLSIDKALELVHVSDDIKDALVSRTGVFAPVLEFIYLYEKADWISISRLAIVHDLDLGDINYAYISSALWYKSIIDEIVSQDGDGFVEDPIFN